MVSGVYVGGGGCSEVNQSVRVAPPPQEVGDLRKQIESLQTQKDKVSEELGSVQVGGAVAMVTRPTYDQHDLICRIQFKGSLVSCHQGNGTNRVSSMQVMQFHSITIITAVYLVLAYMCTLNDYVTLQLGQPLMMGAHSQ